MRIFTKAVVSSAILALATLVAVAYGSTPSDHQQGPLVHDRTPHVHNHTMKPHRS